MQPDSVLIDQRFMVGPYPLNSADDVERAWQSAAPLSDPRHPGFLRNGTRVKALEESKLKAVAYVNHGRWVADCPADDCYGAMACWSENPRSCCLDCGRIYAVTYPSERELADAEKVLAGRPEPARNWDVHKGEALVDLKLDNLTRGFSLTGARPLDVDLAEVHGISRGKARELKKAIEETGNTLLLPEDL